MDIGVAFDMLRRQRMPPPTTDAAITASRKLLPRDRRQEFRVIASIYLANTRMPTCRPLPPILPHSLQVHY